MLTNDGEALEIGADSVFINAGARPANPPIEGLDNVPALNSIMELGELPEHLLGEANRSSSSDPSARP